MLKRLNLFFVDTLTLQLIDKYYYVEFHISTSLFLDSVCTTTLSKVIKRGFYFISYLFFIGIFKVCIRNGAFMYILNFKESDEI